jgi:glucosamine--fructose-6-phosphate aminotransferase (isomerizing)
VSVLWSFMCGIIAILSRPSTRAVPEASALVDLLDRAVADQTIAGAAAHAASCDELLHGVPGVCALVGRHELVASLTSRLDQLEARASTHEQWIEQATDLSAEQIELANAELIALRDAVWAIRHDRLRTAREVDALAGRDAGRAAVAGYLAVQQALSAIDRLEVRGRDSAGLHLYVWDHGLSPDDPAVRSLLAQRLGDPLFQNGSVRLAGPCLSFVYKAAAEIGELGDNTRALRAAIQADDLLRLSLARPEARLTVLGHTRWASVGIISEPNCHPLNSEESEMSGADRERPYVVAALNGDVDNHADIKVQHELKHPRPDHHRCEGDPGRDVAPRRRHPW